MRGIRSAPLGAGRGWAAPSRTKAHTDQSRPVIRATVTSQASPPGHVPWPRLIPFALGHQFSCALLTRNLLSVPADIETGSDIALYSGLGAAVIAVAVLVVGVTLYRRSQSEYGTDVVDSAALTGAFQTFHFKTGRQG